MVIANQTRSHFETLSAVMAGNADIRDVIEKARAPQGLTNQNHPLPEGCRELLNRFAQAPVHVAYQRVLYLFFTYKRVILVYVETFLLEAVMKITQNVTLAIPKDVLRKAKILAVQKNTSLSSLLTQTLIHLVAHQEAYEQAWQRNLALLRSGLSLGTRGQMPWKREELHER